MVVMGPVTPGCRKRLIAHYGTSVTSWLDRVPGVLAAVAQRWNLSVVGYHDAGHASVLALAETSSGQPVVLKAWFDRERFRAEAAALRHWELTNGHVVLATDDQRAVGCLDLVGGMAGGSCRSTDDESRVAEAVEALHAQPAPEAVFDSLDNYLRETVLPRVGRRASRYDSVTPTCGVGQEVNATPPATRDPGVLLHGDLYRENVPVDVTGRPVLLDPLPLVGDPAFDWAFFTVYYNLDSDPVERLHLAMRASGMPPEDLLPWCRLLCLDGLLYYHEIGDPRERRMSEVAAHLARQADGL